MQKDYQEIERIIDSLSYHRENTPGTYSNIRYYTENEVRKALTTYGNAREQATVEEIIKIVEKYFEGLIHIPDPQATKESLIENIKK
jgi:hypothetical protein